MYTRVPSSLGVALSLALVLSAVLADGTRAAAQVTLTIDPAMTKGAEGAPVVIVEFSDYQ